MQELYSLKNQLLIAMPQLEDSWFGHTVTYLCEYDEHGAMGLVLNKPVAVTFEDICDQLDIPRLDGINPDIFSGGPVNPSQGFILHEDGTDWEATLNLADGIALSSSKDILSAIAGGSGPKHFRMALGYAGWSAGQLDDELRENAWLTIPAEPQLLFHTATDALYSTALKRLGVDSSHLSGDIGHA